MGLYIPLSEDEQEVLSRLADSKDMCLKIKGFGQVESPAVICGDLRVSIPFRLDFFKSSSPLYFLDLELTTGAGIVLFKKRMSININGGPLQVIPGSFVELIWDIAIDHMDPNLVKALKPGALGLTSRRIDAETREKTYAGNMDLNRVQKIGLRLIEKGASNVRRIDENSIIEATKKSGGEMHSTDKGVEVPEGQD